MVAKGSNGGKSPGAVHGVICPHFAVTSFGEVR
jgi:hypothetical protein